MSDKKNKIDEIMEQIEELTVEDTGGMSMEDLEKLKAGARNINKGKGGAKARAMGTVGKDEGETVAGMYWWSCGSRGGKNTNSSI